MTLVSDLTIITNNVPRVVIDGYELTAAERAEFDYYRWPDTPADDYRAGSRDGEEASFVRYRGELHDLGEFTACSEHGWDGIHNETFFSGVLVRYVDDHERVIVARYYA